MSARQPYALERLVAGAAWTEVRAVEDNLGGLEGLSRRRRSLDRGRSPHSPLDPREGHVGPERALLGLVEARRCKGVRRRGLHCSRAAVLVVEIEGEQA